MGEFDKDKFLTAFASAKLMAHITKSTNPAIEKELEKLRFRANELFDLAARIADSNI